MHPILARIGPLYIYSYGLMVAIGFAAATLLAYNKASEFGINRDKIIDFGIVILLGGIIGARALYVILNLQYYIKNPLEILNLTRGGLVWYGAFLSGLIAGTWFVRKNKIDFWTMGDLFAPYIVLAQAFGRVGCLLNGCCYGSVSSPGFILGVVFPSESVLRHPTQVYSAIVLLLIFIILRLWQEKGRFKGQIFLGYLIFYSMSRFSLEFLRGDNPKDCFGFTISQMISIVIFIICITVFVQRLLKWKHSSKSV
ncbi:MAG: prolipoprotein diacylglyceryl transferase [Candidatus Omnitrophota bacterium]|nr:prolipoprotein diacylglyceryl transferase [Candidatus Omnitrophota bacterium]